MVMFSFVHDCNYGNIHIMSHACCYDNIYAHMTLTLTFTFTLTLTKLHMVNVITIVSVIFHK